MSYARRLSLLAAVVAGATICITAPSHAASNMRWGAEVGAAFNTCSMGDWNDLIDQSNSAGANFDNIKSGFSFGGGPTMILNDAWRFGAHYERIMGKTSSDQGTEVKPVANAFGVSGAYMFPTKSTSGLGLGLGVSVDYMSLAGSLSSAGTGSFDTHGTGVGFQFFGLSEYAFSPAVAGTFSAGYRVANIDIKDIGGQDVSGSGLSSEDYSGLVLRVGVSFHQSTH